jgi:hypothetical protein
MTIERILGYVVSTILVGIGLKIGDHLCKKCGSFVSKTLDSLTSETEAMLPAPKPEVDSKKNLMDKFMNPTMVQPS